MRPAWMWVALGMVATLALGSGKARFEGPGLKVRTAALGYDYWEHQSHVGGATGTWLADSLHIVTTYDSKVVTIARVDIQYRGGATDSMDVGFRNGAALDSVRVFAVDGKVQQFTLYCRASSVLLKPLAGSTDTNHWTVTAYGQP